MYCIWLPEMIEYPDWSNYDEYENNLYEIFKADYLNGTICFQGKIIKLRYEPRVNDKEESFYHLTCKNYDNKSTREPDPERMVRIKWPKAFIENYLCSDTCCAEKPLYWIAPHKYYNRYKILFENYIVIIEDRVSYYLLITGFWVDSGYRNKLIKEYNKFR